MKTIHIACISAALFLSGYLLQSKLMNSTPVEVTAEGSVRKETIPGALPVPTELNISGTTPLVRIGELEKLGFDVSAPKAIIILYTNDDFFAPNSAFSESLTARSEDLNNLARQNSGEALKRLQAMFNRSLGDRMNAYEFLAGNSPESLDLLIRYPGLLYSSGNALDVLSRAGAALVKHAGIDAYAKWAEQLEGPLHQYIARRKWVYQELMKGTSRPGELLSYFPDDDSRLRIFDQWVQGKVELTDELVQNAMQAFESDASRASARKLLDQKRNSSR